MQSSPKTTTPENQSAPQTEHFAARCEDMYAEAGHFMQSLQDAASDLHDYVHTNLKQQPLKVLGLAAASGFVLAGGLTPRVGKLLLTLSGRLLAQRLWREVIG